MGECFLLSLCGDEKKERNAKEVHNVKQPHSSMMLNIGLTLGAQDGRARGIAKVGGAAKKHSNESDQKG